MKKIIAYTSTLLLALILSGCNLNRILPTPDLAIGFLGPSGAAVEEGATEGSVSELVITDVDTVNTETERVIRSNRFLPLVRLRVQAKPGSVGAYIESYSIDYFLANGNQVLPDNQQSYRGVVQLTVDDGVICRETRPEVEPIDCDINDYNPENPDRDFEYAYGDPVISENIAPITGEMASKLEGTTGSYATIVVEGKDANNRSFSQKLDPVKIVYFGRTELFEPTPEEDDEEETPAPAPAPAPENPAPEDPAPEDPAPEDPTDG